MELRGKKVLVTGGAGFIGSHLTDRLLEMKNTVVVYDNFDDFYGDKEKNLQSNVENTLFRLVKGDILNYKSLASAMKGVDMVFHEAAQCGIRYCIRNPWKAHEVNVTGTLNVLMAARQTGVRKVVFPSSSGIFGVPQYTPMDERHPTNPNSTYGASKLAAEKYCLAFHEVYGVDVVSLRYFSVYGPRGRPDQVIRAFVSAIAKSERPVIYGDGTQTRDFTFISDVVEATILAAECDDVAGETFNIGFGNEISINELFDMLSNKLGKKGEVQPIYKETYRGEFPQTLADNTKARDILGWKPMVDVGRGLDIFVEWFLKTGRVS